MRCLGIPNTKHFHDVVRIEDARRLYEKLRTQLAAEVFVAAHEEEWEDCSGSVPDACWCEGVLRSRMQQPRCLGWGGGLGSGASAIPPLRLTSSHLAWIWRTKNAWPRPEFQGSRGSGKGTWMV